MQRYYKGLAFVTLVILVCKSTPAEMEKRIVPQEIAPINAPFDMPQPERPVFADRAFLISDYGAKGDGQFKNTDAIARAENLFDRSSFPASLAISDIARALAYM